MVHITSYKFRAYPNKKQRDQFFQDYGSAKFAWNFIRRICMNAYKKTAKFDEAGKYIKGTGKTPSFTDRSKILTGLRHDPDYGFMVKGMCVSQQQALIDFTTSLNHFFRNPKENGYPKYKDKYDKKSARYTCSKKPIQLNNIFVPGQGWVKINNSYFKKLTNLGCEIPEIIPKMVTMECDKTSKFWISVSFETHFEKLQVTSNAVGIDLGIKTFAYLSDGTKIEYNKIKLKRLRRYSRRYQRQADKAQHGSSRQKKNRRLQNKTNHKIRNITEDVQHKASTEIVKRNQVVVIENLAITNMLKNTRLASQVSEQRWYSFIVKLKYKSTRYGRTLIAIDRFFPSSKLCSCCGHKMDKMELSVRTWTCPKCNTEHERDLNAAKNILNEGLMSLVPGGTGELTDVDIEKIRETQGRKIPSLSAMSEPSIIASVVNLLDNNSGRNTPQL